MYKRLCTKNILNIVILAVYAVFTFVMLLHHEIWADEAQVWLVVRDLSPVGIFEHVRTEGHPLLWYLMVFPFVKILHFSNAIFSMQLLNWLIVLAGMAVLFFKSPFNIYVKSSILLSSGFLYWFPLNARSYCLIPFLIFLLGGIYNRRKENPVIYGLLIILLANTHIIVFGFCSALAMLFAYESIKSRNKKAIVSASIVLLSLLSIVLYLFGAQNENFVVKDYSKTVDLAYIKAIYSKVIFYLHGFVNIFNTLLISLFLIFCGVIFFVKNKKIFFIYVFTLLYQFSIYVFVWGILSQRAYILLLVIIFCFQVIYREIERPVIKNIITVMLVSVFLFSFPEAIRLLKQDYLYEFSGGRKTAEFIKKNIPQDAFIVTNYPITTVSISVYLPKNKWKFYYDGYNDFYTYAAWNKVSMNSQAPVNIIKHLQQHKLIYIILSAGSFYQDLKPVYESNSTVFTNQEKFRIYKLEGF